MFIQTESTPNPSTLKFLPGQEVLEVGTADFASETAAQNSPLAQRIFQVPDVFGVFFGLDFITVTKSESVDWDVIKPDILSRLMDFFSSDLPVVDNGNTPDKKIESSKKYNKKDSKIVLQIKELLEEKIKPAVAQDGGDIQFVRYEDDIVFLELRGSCAGCPSSTLTLKSGIENMLKYYIPEIKSVEAIN